jgi:membrane protein
MKRRAQEAGKKFLPFAGEFARRAGRSEITTMASSLAFTTVLSIAPLLAVIFYVFKAFGGLQYAYAKLEPFILNTLSEGTGETVRVHLNAFIHRVHAKAVGWVGIAGLLFTSVTTYFTIVKTFNQIWEVNTPLPLPRRIARALALIAVGPLLMTASIALTTAAEAHIKVIPFSSHFMAYILSFITYMLVYKLIPTVRVPWRAIFFGAMLPAAMLELAKLGYTVYAKHVVTYANFYGSFAAIPLFLLWIYIAWYITLLGAVCVRTLQG